MLFKSNGKFTDNITDSFDRFGIQTRNVTSGANKHTKRFEMYDSIHDNNYIALALDKPLGSDPKKWEKVIREDLAPLLNEASKPGDFPASAFIVPSKDIETVEELLKKDNITPSVYQLFPGYVVAGINKKDTAKIISKYKPERPKEEEKKVEEKQTPENLLNDLDKQSSKKSVPPEAAKKEAKQAEPKKEVESESKPSEASVSEPAIKKKKPKKEVPFSKKLATAALMGAALGAAAVGGVKGYDKLQDYLTPDNVKKEQAVLKESAKKYFDTLTNGSTETDSDLLEKVAGNPNLLNDYIKELADTPVQAPITKRVQEAAIKNGSIPQDILKEKMKNKAARKDVAANPSATSEMLRELSKDKDNEVLKSLAQNESTPRDILDNLSKYPALHNDLLANKALDNKTYKEIISNNRHSKDCAYNTNLYQNPCTSVADLIYNANNPDECIRRGIASNPNCPKELLANLANDSNPLVRKEALKNKNVPQDSLNALFEPHWVKDETDAKKESDRKAALSNPTLSREIRDKALLMDPKEYGKSIAENPATNANDLRYLKAVAEGKSPVMNFVEGAKNLATDKDKLTKLAENYNKSKDKNLNNAIRKMVNKEFVENVFDPYNLIDTVRNIPFGKREKEEKDNKNNSNSQAIPGFKNVNSMQNSVLDSKGEAPLHFSSMPLPPHSEGSLYNNPAVEKAILDTAEDITNGLFNDSVEQIKSGLRDGGFLTDADISASGNGANGLGGSGSGAGGGAGAVAVASGAPSGSIPVGSGEYKIGSYKNACEKMNNLYKIFDKKK